ncbi:hypothetical protein KY312_03385, partial [Candidatus Woesearchaeota archaeon]|nr:hypothetical protein [Candidatus Woesearchaeota archaeon]
MRKLIIFIAMMLAMTGSVFADEFVSVLDGNGNDYGYGVVQTSDGGYAVTGYTQSYGGGDNDIILTKFDSSGTEQWTSTLGGTSDDRGYDVIQTSDGGFVVSGQTASYGSGTDIILVKFNEYGDEQWTSTLGGTSVDAGRGVIQTSDGGYAVTGKTQSYGSINYDVILVKFNEYGDEQWTSSLAVSGLSDDAEGWDVIQTSDGGYAVAGYILDGMLADIILVKFDSSGNEQWTSTFRQGPDSFYGSVIQTSDGGFVVSGTTVNYGGTGNDIFLVKFD